MLTELLNIYRVRYPDGAAFIKRHHLVSTIKHYLLEPFTFHKVYHAGKTFSIFKQDRIWDKILSKAAVVNRVDTVQYGSFQKPLQANNEEMRVKRLLLHDLIKPHGQDL